MSHIKKALHEGLVEQELDNPIEPTDPIHLEVPKTSEPRSFKQLIHSFIHEEESEFDQRRHTLFT